ncbi:MAG: hypothetical protein U1E16_04730 [Hyphomicrobiales bacterium]
MLYKGPGGSVARECIIDLRWLKERTGLSVEDVAKRLVDYGFHALPRLPVPDTLMIEPTESESKRELDRFCDAMIEIRKEIAEVEEGTADRFDNVPKNAPHTHRLLLGDWKYPYSKEKAFFPLKGYPNDKYCRWWRASTTSSATATSFAPARPWRTTWRRRSSGPWRAFNTTRRRPCCWRRSTSARTSWLSAPAPWRCSACSRARACSTSAAAPASVQRHGGRVPAAGKVRGIDVSPVMGRVPRPATRLGRRASPSAMPTHLDEADAAYDAVVSIQVAECRCRTSLPSAAKPFAC